MSEMNINELTDEALLEVFAFLDESSIINAMDVCERWDELITAKTTLHAQFILDLKCDSKKPRHYNKFIFQKLDAKYIRSETDNKRQMEAFHRNKENIKEAEISFSTWSLVEKDLMGMTNLVRLSLSNMKFTQSPAKLSMFNLKELRIECSPDFLDVPNLVKVFFWGPRLPTEFLETCKKLTHLTYLTNFYYDTPTEISAISPHLTFLDVHALGKTSLIPLLESQKTSLKKLKMSNNKQDEIEFAINQMRLEKLNIHIPNDLGTLSNNSTIKELKIKSYKKGFQALEKVIKSCTSTEKLIIDIDSEDGQETLVIASEFLPNLKHLVIRREYVDVQVENLPLYFIRTFDSMESILLTIHDDSNMDAYLRLLANCPNLRKLKVYWLDHDMFEIEPIIPDELQRILDTVPDLDELFVYKIFTLSHDVIKILQKSKIRTLKFTVYEDLFEEQLKLAIQLSKQSDIRCTVFSIKRLNLVNSFDQLSTDDFDEYLYTCGNYNF